MNDRTRVIVPVDEQRVREIVAEELAKREDALVEVMESATKKLERLAVALREPANRVTEIGG
jgi:hypothetical protein